MRFFFCSVYVKIILNALTQFSINEHVHNSKIPPIAHKKLLLNLYISYFELLVNNSSDNVILI